MSRVAPIAALLAAALGLAQAARADDPPTETRAAVEQAFLDGRVTDAQALVPPSSRMGPSGPGSEPGELDERMFGWRHATGDRLWGSPLVPKSVPPVVAALLRERKQRETSGLRGLPEESPLAALPDPDGRIRRALDLQRAIYRPVRDEDSPDPETATKGRQRVARAHDLMQRSGLLAGGAIAALVLLALLAAWLTRQRVEAP